MISVSTTPTRRSLCNGLSRRDFLRIGALTPVGLSLAHFLSLEKSFASASGSRAKSVILVYLGGGLSHHDSFDPKPEAVEEIRGKYGTIPTSVKGLHITDKLPKMAAQMELA